MPSRPSVAAPVVASLQQLGAALRARRKTQRVSAAAAAEAAGMARATWVRIESGHPSVTIGAVETAARVLGLELRLIDPAATTSTSTSLPERLTLDAYPGLASIAWQLDKKTSLTPRDALALYQRNWRHLDVDALSDDERGVIRALCLAFGEPPLV